MSLVTTKEMFEKAMKEGYAIGAFNETDPNLINIMYLELIKAYNKPIEEFNQNKITDSLQNSGVEDITKLLNSLQNIDKLKGFK